MCFKRIRFFAAIIWAEVKLRFCGRMISAPTITVESKRQNENRRRPERWRSGIEISVLSVERFSPLMKGTAFAGANCRGWKAFLWQHKRRSASCGRYSEAFTGAAVGFMQGVCRSRKTLTARVTPPFLCAVKEMGVHYK